MPTFSNLSDLAKYLNKESSTVLKTKVAPVVVEKMSEVIQGENVYGAYVSNAENPYERRGIHGGLADTSNYQVELIDDNTIAITNETMTADGRTQLDKYIVYGNMYDWENSEVYNMQPFPRDFYSYTVEGLKRTGEHIDAFVEGMKAKGFRFS